MPAAFEFRVPEKLPMPSLALRPLTSDSDALDLKADKVTTITGGVLATGGGSFAANRVIIVNKATQAEAAALTLDTVAVTPFALAKPVGDLNTAIAAATAAVVWKTAARVATTVAGTLASSFENGDLIDGVALATGDRILIKNQAAAADNGIYVVNASGAPTRTTDADAGAELVNAGVSVSAGSSNGGTQWRQTAPATITLGTTALTWVKVVDQSAIDQEVIAARAPEASLKARLDNTLVAGKSDTAYVDENGYSAKFAGAGGRVLMAWDGEGTLADSHGLVQELHRQMGINSTASSIENLPWVNASYTFTDWNGVSVQGQSNAASSAGAVLTTTQPFNNKRLNSGSTAMIPLVETTAETTTAGATAHAKWRVLKAMKPWETWSINYDWTAIQMGAGNTPFSGIKKGTTPYNQGLAKVTSTKTLATAATKTYAERAILFLHGESDANIGTTQAAYRDEMILLKNDWNTDVLAATGQVNRLPMLVAQVAISDTGLTGTNHGTCFAMLDAAEADNEIFVVVPGYAFTFIGDGLHYDAYDQRLIGEYFGKALNRYYIEKRSPSTVRPIAWTIVDSRAIEVTFYVPVPPLVFDTDWVWPPDVGLGFAIYSAADTGATPVNEIAISDVRIIPGNKVRIVTTADVSSGCFVTYAEKEFVRTFTGGLGSGYRRGPRGCLRDSDFTATYYPDRDGNFTVLPNWCVAFRKALA